MRARIDRCTFLGLLSWVLFTAFPVSCLAQPDTSPSDTVNFRKRRSILFIGGAATYTSTMIGLNEIWFKDSPRENFHFFNDSREWNQMDKAGHFLSAFHISSFSHRALRWSGVRDSNAQLAGSLTALALMSSIEIFDGYSSAYGASMSDIAANAAGAALYLAQYKSWGEIRVHPKFTFHHTGFARERPLVLGSNFPQQLIKDYNGQSYWLSIDVDKFMKFPAWLNIAVGYGAEEMVYATSGANRAIGLRSYRQFYISPDFDVTAFKTKSKWIRALIYAVNMIRIPAPALELSQGKMKLHAAYF